MRNLRQPGDVRVNVEAHRGLGVPETAGQLDGLDAGLMPQGSPAVAKAMWAETGEAHSGANLVAIRDAEWQRRLQGGDKEAWGVDSSAYPLTLSSLAWYANTTGGSVYVIGLQGKRFRHASTQLLHDENGQTKAHLQTYEDGNDRIFVGWCGFLRHYAWKLDAPVPRHVHDTGEVQHHAQVADEQTDGTGLVLAEGADELDDVTNREVVDWDIAETVKKRWRSEPVTAEGALGDVAATGEPFRVDVTDAVTANDGSVHLSLRVLRSGQPVRYEITSYHGFALRPKSAPVLHLRIPAAAPVADVEPAAVPGVTRTNVKSGHQ